MTQDLPNAEMVSTFKAELELCEVKPGDTVAIYTEGSRKLSYARAFSQASAELGAHVFHLDMPEQPPRLAVDLGGRAGGSGLSATPAAIAAFERSDLLVDLAFLLFTEEQQRVRAAGTRVLACVEPFDVLKRLFPSEDQRRRALEGEHLLAESKTLRIANDAGTDLTYEFGKYKAHCQYGFSDEPGRWDHFASTLVTHVADDEAVNGTLVLQPGDMVFPFNRYVEAPVRMRIEDGRVQSIDGGLDAMLIREYMASFDDERGYGISHIGWGLNERARWDAIATGSESMGCDARSYYGCVMFSTGPNTHHGGTNDTLCHVDIPMRGCSLWLDGNQVIDHGRLLEGSQQIRDGAAAAV